MNLHRPVVYIAIGAVLSIFLMSLITLTATWANVASSVRLVPQSDITVDAPGLFDDPRPTNGIPSNTNLTPAVPISTTTDSQSRPNLPETSAGKTALDEAGPTASTHGTLDAEDRTEQRHESEEPDEDDGVRIIRERDDSRRDALRRTLATAQATRPLRIVNTPASPPTTELPPPTLTPEPPLPNPHAADIRPTDVPPPPAAAQPPPARQDDHDRKDDDEHDD